MDFAYILKKRRMVRRFSTDPVPRKPSNGSHERPSARRAPASARAKGWSYWWLDIGCTVMLIILAAIDEGLASGFAGPFPHLRGMNLVRSALGIPERFTPVGSMPVGYPLPDPPSPSLKRGAVKREDFTRWNGW